MMKQLNLAAKCKFSATGYHGGLTKERDASGCMPNQPGPIAAISMFIMRIVLGGAILLIPPATNAYAMHISEGILPLNWAALWFVIAGLFVACGLVRLNKISSTDISFKPLVGLMSAVVFIISCMPIPVPTAGTCSHPCGTGMSAILLGPPISILIAAVALLIQALFLSHGGLSTWGANIVSMGVMGSFAGYGTFAVLRAFGVRLPVAGFVAGLFADWATYLGTAAILALGIAGADPFMPIFTNIIISFIPTQLPLGIIEGAMTAGLLILLAKRRPDLLVKMKVIKSEDTGIR